MNADDVVFSFQPHVRQVEPALQERQRQLSGIRRPHRAGPAIDRQDRDDTVVFKLKSPLAPLLTALTVQPFSISSAEYAASAAEDRASSDELDQSPIGTGPFSSCSIRRTRVVRFRAFPDFWGKRPARSRTAWQGR